MNRRNYLTSMYGKTSLYKQEVKDCFKELNIRGSREQFKWIELWANIDIDESNGMSMDEFCNFFGFAKGTAVVLRTFELFNKTGTGEVTFIEFMHGVWDLCNYDDDRSKKFRFQVLQKSGQRFEANSVVDLRDIRRTLAVFYGQYNIDVYAAMVNAVADDDTSGGVSFDEFLDFGKAHQLLQYPGYWVQNKLRDAVFGRKYWLKAMKKRKYMYRRNRPLEIQMKRFEDEGNKHLVNGRRNFEVDFHWEGKRPNVTKKFQIVPVANEKDEPEVSYNEHVHRVGFF